MRNVTDELGHDLLVEHPRQLTAGDEHGHASRCAYECRSRKARTRLPRVLGVRRELLLLAVEEAVRRAGVDDELVLDARGLERLVERLRRPRAGYPGRPHPGAPGSGRPSRPRAASAWGPEPTPSPGAPVEADSAGEVVPARGGEPRVAAAEAEADREDALQPASRRCATPAPTSACTPSGGRLLGRAACTRSRRRASRRRRCGRSSRTPPPRTRARRSGARAPRRSGTGRGRPGRIDDSGAGGLVRRRDEGREAVPVGRLEDEVVVRDRCTESGGIGGDESRSKHIASTLQRGHEPLEVLVARPPADGRTHEPAPGEVADDDAGLRERATTEADSSGGTRHETSVARSSGTTTSAPDSCRSSRRRSAVGRGTLEPPRRLRPRAPRRPTRAAFGVRFGSKRAAPDVGSKAPSGS